MISLGSLSYMASFRRAGNIACSLLETGYFLVKKDFSPALSLMVMCFWHKRSHKVATLRVDPHRVLLFIGKRQRIEEFF